MTPGANDYFINGCGRCSHYGTPQCKVHTWSQELHLLRSLIAETELEETIKWKHPCYTLNNKNVVLLHCFKDYAALAFFKGSIMKDPEKLLVQQTENVQATRQLRFTSIDEVIAQESIIRSYLQEAIEIEKKGLKVEMKETKSYDVPEELEEAFKEDIQFKNAFESLTPGRQRGYLLHYSGAKQSATRTSRIEKSKEQVFKGKGWNER